MRRAAWHLTGLAALGVHVATDHGWLILLALACLLAGVRGIGR